MIERCRKSDLPIGTCADACCRPDLKHDRPAPELWMRNAEAAPRPQYAVPGPSPKAMVSTLYHSPPTGDRLDVHDMVRELCDTTQHNEPYYLGITGRTRHHVSIAQPLIVQLYQATTPSTAVEAGVLRPSASKPAARLDAIDAAVRIETEAARLLRALGEDDSAEATRLVRKLGSLVPSLARCHRLRPARDGRQVTCCFAHVVEASITTWWTWARIATGWDLPAWQPDNTCPLCGTRGTLRIRVVEQLATCIHDPCRETWDHNTIGLLADHIRSENHEDEEAS